MATTTPNFGWSVPTSTDLVKDGATAIETLGDAIDASLLDLKGGTTGQLLAKNSNTDMDFSWVAPSVSGFSLINTTTITNGVSSTSLNNVFSSTYKTYRVIINWLQANAGTPTVSMRLRVSGSDNSSAFSYQPRGWSNISGTLAGFGTAGTSLPLNILTSTNPFTIMDITLPFETKQTGFSISSFEPNNNDSWGYGAVHNQAVSYDGFTVFPASSTFAGGTIYVYGYGA